MRVLHFDCFSGISGDMTLAALIDVGADLEAIKAGLASLNLPIRLDIEQVKRNGIAATRIDIEAPEQEEHRYLKEIEAIIDAGQLSDHAKKLAREIFHKLADAEAFVHGTTPDKVHFHEVGALDSIADIVGVAIAVDSLKIDRFTSRSVPPGSGIVHCAHGIMPIPAPATAKLLTGVPLAASQVKGEMVTPTGAAILTSLVNEYTEHPIMTIHKIGCGAGKRDPWEQPNILRLFLGEAMPQPDPHESDTVVLLETNLDDCSGEILAFTLERLFDAGAIDAFSIPIQMKKNRPGVLLSVLSPTDRVTVLEQILFRETGTFGIRRSTVQRTKLHREIITVESPWGLVKVKKGWNQLGHAIKTPEFEDCAKIAREQNLPLREVYAVILKAAETARDPQ